MSHVDAVVVGSGPNGLAAAIAIARTGRKVIVFEAADTVGGGCHSAELTLPGFVHDVCSAVHPFAVVSPFFQSLPLNRHGLEWINPAGLCWPILSMKALQRRLHGSVELTGEGLGRDEAAYRRLFNPLVKSWPKIAESVLGPLRWPRHPLALARFGLRGAAASGQSRSPHIQRRAGARSLFAGIAAHSMLPLEKRPTGGIALALTLAAHVGGWCFPRGGAAAFGERARRAPAVARRGDRHAER